MITPHLRTQSSLLAEIRRMMRDPAGENSRWTDAEIYDAINTALDSWHGRVQVPRFYDIDWVSGTYEYTLPDYINADTMDVQAKHTIWGLNATTEDEWGETYEDMVAWHVIPSSTGGQTLVVEHTTYSTDGRIIWWGYNGRIPTTIPTLDDGITATATTAELATVVTDIGRSGYVKIGNEWLSYAGYSDDASNSTLAAMVRGLDGTTAAIHAAAAQVEFGVAAPDGRLWGQLFNQVAAELHRMFLTNGGPNEGEHHERILGLHEKRVNDFWRSWSPVRPPKVVLSRRAIGGMTE